MIQVLSAEDEKFFLEMELETKQRRLIALDSFHVALLKEVDLAEAQINALDSELIELQEKLEALT